MVSVTLSFLLGFDKALKTFLIMATATVQSMKEQIQHRITTAPDVYDLLPIMQFLSLSAIKEFVTDQIDHDLESLDPEDPEDTYREIYYNGLSITDILPGDVVQHIISFNDVCRHKAVSKTWKSLSEKSEMTQMRELYRATIVDESHEHESAVTWIVHPKRKHLNTVEIELGYKGPLTIDLALYHIEKELFGDGDRLLLHDGTYESSTACIIGQDVHFIGLGNKVIFKANDQSTFKLGDDKLNVSFENIAFHTGSVFFANARSIFISGANHRVRIEKCSFHRFATAIRFCAASSCELTVNDCEFAEVERAFFMDDNVNVEFTNCLFKKCKKHAISLLSDESNSKMPILKCIGNTFEEIARHPIVVYSDIARRRIYRPVIAGLEQYFLRDNIVKGNNKYNEQEFDANTVYKIHRS